MKKIVLAIDELRVDSFETGAETDGTRGTVRGYITAVCGPRTYPDDTCQAGSCVDTCLVPKTGTICFPC